MSYLILANDYYHVGKILPTLFDSGKSYDIAKGKLLKGEGLGHNVIRAYDDSISEGDVRSALATLKADGSFKQVLRETEDIIDNENRIIQPC